MTPSTNATIWATAKKLIRYAMTKIAVLDMAVFWNLVAEWPGQGRFIIDRVGLFACALLWCGLHALALACTVRFTENHEKFRFSRI